VENYLLERLMEKANAPNLGAAHEKGPADDEVVPEEARLPRKRSSDMESGTDLLKVWSCRSICRDLLSYFSKFNT